MFQNGIFQQPSKMPSQCKMKVSFYPTVQIVPILSIYNYTATETNATWYNEDELERIIRRAIVVISIMENTDQTKKYCTRGLERHTRLGSITRYKNRSEAREAVFQGQEKSCDDQSIADAYKNVTSSCQMWAEVMGRRDEMAVEAYLFHDNDDEKFTKKQPPPRILQIPHFKLLKSDKKMMPTNPATSIGPPVRNYQSTPAA